jgi:cell division protein YceG involved in septum cleavage
VKLYLRQNPPDFGLQAGKYQIPSGTIEEIIEALKKPMNESDENITFLEGWNIYDIDKTLVSK